MRGVFAKHITATPTIHDWMDITSQRIVFYDTPVIADLKNNVFERPDVESLKYVIVEDIKYDAAYEHSFLGNWEEVQSVKDVSIDWSGEYKIVLILADVRNCDVCYRENDRYSWLLFKPSELDAYALVDYYGSPSLRFRRYWKEIRDYVYGLIYKGNWPK